MFFLALMVAVVAFLLYVDVVEVIVVRIVPFLNKRLALDNSLKWPIFFLSIFFPKAPWQRRWRRQGEGVKNKKMKKK